MKNRDDYEAGWTKPIVNPKTGKKCSGGAARNHRTANAGGVENIRAGAFMEGINYVTPILEQYRNQLKQNEKMIEKMAFIMKSSKQIQNK
ncbi:MAG: hypothetical protein AB7E04_08535 [Desulfobacteraceae bacterium]